MSTRCSDAIQVQRSEARSSRVARSLRAVARGGIVLAVGLVLGSTAVTAHAEDEDAPVPPRVVQAVGSPTASVAPSFHWSVQLLGGVAMAGISPDLPAAIQLANEGMKLDDLDAALVARALTQQAQQAGVSMTSTRPAAVVPTPPLPGDDSGE